MSSVRPSEGLPAASPFDMLRVRACARTLGRQFKKPEEDLLQGLAAAPDPAMALANWERLAEVDESRVALAEVSPSELGGLMTLLGGSQALTHVLQSAGASWLQMFRSCAPTAHRSAADYEGDFRDHLADAWEEFCKQLRRVRNREYLRIGMADLEGRFDVDTTVRELTAVADATCSAAVEWAWHHLRGLYGELWLQAPARGKVGIANSFVVLGMGKLGGGELNFSSDIDLVYLYAADGPPSTGGSRGSVDARAYFIRMAELVTKALHEITVDGFVFRVDLRLRPDGMNGPIANSLANALLYYESYGQTWERTALIQARPIAGNKALGAKFLEEVRPFVFRRYLDFATVADMKAMKARVEGELGGETSRLNVKLGRGGIREVEFLVQVLQLIHGGRDERLRGGGSLRMLQQLVKCGYLDESEGEALRESYRFLRNVEHKIQIVHQRQTHALPELPEEQELLARRLGMRGEASLGRLWQELDLHRGRIRHSFEKLFYEPSNEQRRAINPETDELLGLLEQPDAALARLSAMGFAQPQQSYENILLLRDGPQWAPAHARRRRALLELAPALLAAILRTADPDLALRNMATFVSSIGARTSFLSLLQENPATLRMLVDLFGGSQYLANWFIRHPELLDSLVRADLVKLHREVVELQEELQESTHGAADIEAQLDVLRRFRNHEFLRIGISDLQSLIEPEQVSVELTNVAEACLRHAYDIAAEAVCRRLRRKRLPGQCIVLAMGKLGSSELNYNSDLDLIFVYEDARRGSAGPTAQECFAKLAQTLMMLLQTTTREGIAYKIDTRLRPSGNKGPLVTSFAGFQEYHAESAQIWERQALIKARVVAGASSLAGKVSGVVSQFVFRAPLKGEEVREIRRLRQRMENELGRETADRMNIKTGRGGLVDIEFVTQMLQMHYGTAAPTLRMRGTLAAIAALTEANVLPVADAEVLREGYRFIRRVENTLRLAYDRPVEGIDKGGLRLIARRLGFGADEQGFWKAWQERREAIRACFSRWFDHVEGALH